MYLRGGKRPQGAPSEYLISYSLLESNLHIASNSCNLETEEKQINSIVRLYSIYIAIIFNFLYICK